MNSAPIYIDNTWNTKITDGSGNGPDLYRIVTLKDYSSIVIGTFEETLKIENKIINSEGPTDIFIAKLNHNGSPEWIKRIEDYKEKVFIGNSGAWTFTGGIDLQTDLIVYPTESLNHDDETFIISGTYKNKTNQELYIDDIELKSIENHPQYGLFPGGVHGSFNAKYNLNGELILLETNFQEFVQPGSSNWIKKLNNSHPEVTEYLLDDNSKIIISNFDNKRSNYANLDGIDSLENKGLTDGLIIKLQANKSPIYSFDPLYQTSGSVSIEDYLWLIQLGGEGNDRFERGITLSEDDSFLISGHYTNEAKLNDILLSNLNEEYSNRIFAKIDSNGEINWFNNSFIGDSRLFLIDSPFNNSSIFLGTFSDNIQIGSYVLSEKTNNQNHLVDFVMGSINDQGEIEWIKYINSNTNLLDNIDLEFFDNGTFLVASQYTNNPEFAYLSDDQSKPYKKGAYWGSKEWGPTIDSEDSNGIFVVKLMDNGIYDESYQRNNLIGTNEDTAYLIQQNELIEGYFDNDGDDILVNNLISYNLEGQELLDAIKNNKNGTWTFTPPKDFFGQVELRYEITDSFSTPVSADEKFRVFAIDDGQAEFSLKKEYKEHFAYTESLLGIQITKEDPDGGSEYRKVNWQTSKNGIIWENVEDKKIYKDKTTPLKTQYKLNSRDKDLFIRASIEYKDTWFTNTIYSDFFKITDILKHDKIDDISPYETNLVDISINENSTAVHTFSSDESITWSLNGGTDAGKFNINSSTGALSFANAPDYENPSDSDSNNSYVVGVRATGGTGNTSDQTVTVNINALDEGEASFAISGTAAVGEKLSVSETSADSDGTGTLSYIWQTSTNGTSWSAVGTNDSYTIALAEEGKKIRSVISYTDNQGFAEEVTTDAIAIPYFNNGTVKISIVGDPVIGNTLLLGTEENDPDGLISDMSSSWQSSTDGSTWSEIGTELNYTIQEADAGKNIRLVFSYTDAQGFKDGVTAAAIQVPAADPITGQSFTLDVDGDDKVTAFGDGLMVIRKLFGSAFAGDDLTAKAISADATRSTNEIHEYIQSGVDNLMLDVDGDGKVTAFGDGLMVIRKLFGSAFAGEALTAKAISADATRTTDEIHDYISAMTTVDPIG